MTAPNARFACDCGQVRGEVAPASRALSNRAICYCADCQAFAHQIGRADLLDAKGGTNIVQAPPSAVKFTQGREQIVGLRLSEKGLHRFRAKCCDTPMAYAVSPAVPFVGLLASTFRAAGSDPDAAFGPPRAEVNGEYAIGGTPPGSKGFPRLFLIASVLRILGWKSAGRAWPHPLFARSGAALFPVVSLSREERDRLRPFCGPRPSSA